MRARFIQSGISNIKGTNLVLLISMNKDNQTKEHLEAFFDLVARLNEDRANFRKVIVVVTDYVNRYYVGNKAALRLGDDWINENRTTLEKNSHLVEIVRWNSLISDARFENRLNEIEALYDSDEEFRKITDNLCKRHSGKADKKSAKQYLLEECAGLSLLDDARICYPAVNLNPALSFVFDHFCTGATYHGYEVSKGLEGENLHSTLSKNDRKLVRTANCLLFAMKKNGLNTPEQQIKYFVEFTSRSKTLET